MVKRFALAAILILPYSSSAAPDPEKIRRLTVQLGDADLRLRQAAFDDLLDLAADDPEGVIAAVENAFATMEEDLEVASALKRLKADLPRRIRRKRLLAVARGSEDLVDKIERALYDPGKESVQSLINAARFRKPTAIKLLREFAPERDLTRLELLRVFPDALERARKTPVLWSVGRLGDKEFIPLLAGLLEDPCEDVQGSAAWALLELAFDHRRSTIPDQDSLIREARRWWDLHRDDPESARFR